jgi:hypothetical protein
VQRVVVAFTLRQREELARIAQARVDLLDVLDDAFQRAAFLAQVLGALRVGPDARILERLADFYQP